MRKYLPLLAAAGAMLVPAVVFAKPTIGSVSPTTANAGVSVIMSASVSSAVAIQSCNLYVDLEDVGQMTVANGTASKAYTFPFGGSRIAFVFCRDTQGGLAAGPNTAIWVSGPLQNQPPLSTPEPEPTPEPAPEPTPEPQLEPAPELPPAVGRLIKLACPDGAPADHPCTAVYYVGTDGKRHAFPNSRVFFTWFANFDSVETVNETTLSSYPLGRNVTYRPGVRMVKFTTINRVYAVTRDGVLRWIKTEEAARALYGTDWNTKIDDIADVFYTNYTFGTDIESSADYNPTAETTAATTID